MAANDNFDLILRRYEEIGARLTAGVAGAEYSALSRELSDLEPVVGAIRTFRDKERERAELAVLLTDPGLDAEMRALATDELAAAEAASDEMAKAIRIALLPKDAADEGDAILEVRAGTGGDEAALFAGDLLRMYVKYAESKRWTIETLSMSEGTAGRLQGNRGADFGRGVFARLKFESGVHRVQRVPATETQGRIHTSAATVAVLPLGRGGRISSSTRPTSRSTPCARAAPAASTSTRPNRRSASPTCPPGSWSRCRRSARSTATGRRPWRSCARASSTPQPEARRRAGRGAPLAGRLGRPLAAHPHLQFPAGSGDRPPGQPDPLFARPDMEGEGLDEIVDALTEERQAELLAQQGAE